MYKKILALFVVVITLIAIIFFYYRSQTKEQKLGHILDQITTELNARLKTNQMDALELAIVLSKNTDLTKALENDDEDLGYSILSNIVKNIQKNTGRFVRAQVITADYHIFARSWDTIYAGMPLGSYRTDLKYFKTSSSPRTSIEVGRKLGFKATVPMYKNKKLLGFMEVIGFFEPLTELFRAQGIDLYVLMDDKYYDTAIFMQENLLIHKYVVANTNYNAAHVKILKSIDFKRLKTNRIISTGHDEIFYEAMHNGAGETIGAFVFILPDKYLDYFQDPEDDISFLINVTRSSLYNIEKEKTYQNNMYGTYTPREMLYLKDIISQEDEPEFTKEAYQQLNRYSKDELIQLMLGHKIVKRIDGKIK